MKLESWMRYLVAAALIIMVGAAWVLAAEETMKVEVRSEDGKELTIDVNGVTENITLDDLAEGEERTYDVGGHEVTVKRIDNRLTLVHDGLTEEYIRDCHHQKIWIEGDDESAGEHRVMIMKHGDAGEYEFDVDAEGDHDVFIIKGEDGEIDIEALKEKYGEDFEEFHTAHGAHVMKWVDEGDGEHPIIIKRMGHPGLGDYVTYRCEETGSMLTVKADENLLDDYLDPVTGCVMKKVKHAGVHMIKIQEKKICKDEDE
ncbi:MAG: hypothetical protein OQK55_08795 [Thermoanaerobaculales bacterium]|nr:hypothetical protein [Thermoanaerobaculales bacterium]